MKPIPKRTYTMTREEQIKEVEELIKIAKRLQKLHHRIQNYKECNNIKILRKREMKSRALMTLLKVAVKDISDKLDKIEPYDYSNTFS